MLREGSSVQNVILFLVLFVLERVQPVLLFEMKPGVIFKCCVMWIPAVLRNHHNEPILRAFVILSLSKIL
jgi:hypothetical protein